MADTLRDLRARPEVWVFLLAYWLYIDGVDTVIRMAVDYGMALGLASQDLVLAILITQFVAFPAALGFIVLARVLGTRGGLFLGLGVYLAVTLWGYVLDSATEFYLLAAVVHAADLIPVGKSRMALTEVLEKALAAASPT